MFSSLGTFWIVLMVSAALGMLGLRMQWRKQVLDQAGLDRCIQEQVGSVLRTNQRIEVQNKALQVARATYLSLKLTAPMAAESIRLSMNQIRFQQNLERLNWEKKRALWWNPLKKCGNGKFFFPIRHPSWNWKETPPDPIGPLPWKFETIPSLSVLELRTKSRRSSACITGIQKARWCSGQTVLEFLVWIFILTGVWVGWLGLEGLEKKAYLHSLMQFPRPLERYWF